MPKWFLLLCLCYMTQLVIAQPPDSIRSREIRTGVYTHVSSVSEKVLRSSTGYDVEVGAFQERKLLEQVYFSYGAGAQFRDYDDIGIVIDTTPMPVAIGDTSIISSFYDVSHREIKLSTQANIRFVYLTDPDIYFIIGVGPEVTFNQRVSNAFRSSLFTDGEFQTIDESSDNPVPVDDDEFEIRNLTLRFDIGIGIELGKFNIEVVNRTNNVHGLGLRVRYTFDTLTF